MIKRLQILINWFNWAAYQKNWRPYPPSHELPLIQKLCPWQCHHCHSRRPFLLWLERGCCARFVMILQKTYQSILVIQTSSQVQSQTPRAVMHKSVINPLVIAKIKTKLLQIPPQTPISLRHKKHIWVLRSYSRDYLVPV